tara:strand:- start:653 stop:967 length:315 start_codon:yes stop_codon:yes gene_type:complete
MPLYEKNLVFIDTILDYVEDLEALSGVITNRIEHEKKYGTGLNGISPPVLEIETYKDMINNLINNTSAFIDKTKREMDYLEEVYNKFLDLANNTGNGYQEVKPS